MRILLVNPPFYRFLGSCNPWLSPGLLYVGTALSKAGHAVKIINLDRLPWTQMRGLRTLFETAPAYQKVSEDGGHPVWDELQEFVRAWQPDMLGATVTTPTLGPALKVARVARDVSPHIWLMAGGPHATVCPADLLKSNEGFDVIVRGEGEIAAAEALRDLERKEMTAAGTVWATSNGPHYCEPGTLLPDLDVIPLPDLSLYAHKPVTDLDLGLVVGSRGCMGHCVFCASPVIWRHRLRLRSPESIVAELADRVEKFGIRHIYFIDDQFNNDLERAKRLCDLISQRKLDISWICEAGVKPFDEDLAGRMKVAGCERVKLGIESGSNRILAAMGKRIRVEESRRCVAVLKKVGLPFTAYALLGMPGETSKEAMATADLVEELSPAYVSISVVTPHPGTELHTRLGKPPTDSAFHQSINPGRVHEQTLERLMSYNEIPGRSRLKQPKIVVTGGCGFIGSHLVRALVPHCKIQVIDDLSTGFLSRIENLPVQFVKRSILSPLKDIIAGADTVFHLAAQVSLDYSLKHAVVDAETNVLGTVNVLEECRKAGVRRIVYASSSAVYADSKLPCREVDLPNPATPYGAAKVAAEAYAKAAFLTWGLETIGLRFFNVYGPGQFSDDLPPGVVSQFCNRTRNGQSLIIFGDGEQTRDFVYVSDVVEACLLAAVIEGIGGQVFNVASGIPTTIQDLAEMVSSDGLLEYESDRDGDVKHNVGDVLQAQRALGFNSNVSLPEGISKTRAHLRTTFEKTDKECIGRT